MTPPKKKNLHILMFSPTVRKLTTQSSYGEPTTGQPLYSFCFMNLELTTSFLKCVCTLNCVWLFATTWTIAPQAPLSVEFSRQEYWIGLPFPTPGDLPKPGIESMFPALAGRFFTTAPPRKRMIMYTYKHIIHNIHM